jgi:ketosteroid isomerase-like protein
LIELEEGFWRSAGDRDGYSAHLADDAIHVFPGWGLTSENERVLEAVESVEPWEMFEMEDTHVLDLGDRAAALVYKAHAKRAGQEEYVAAMTSVYRRDDSGWKLVIHQQTPL